MTSVMDVLFKRALKKLPHERTSEDLNIIYSHFHGMDILSHLREHQLRSMCTVARYERHEANHVLFYPDSLSTCWYILLSGSVFMKESMFLPRCCFGKQSGGRRGCECITLEPSEMIVVENVNPAEGTLLQREAPHRQSRRHFAKLHSRGDRQNITDNVESSGYLPLPADLTKMHLTDSPHSQMTHVSASQSGCSIASDSGSSSLSDIYQATESEVGDVDLSGLPEAAVDSEEEEEEDEDIERASDTLLGRDVVRDCLEKLPIDRTEDDVEQLLEFMHQLPAFANMTMSVRRELCSVMVSEVVEQAGAVILQDGQELDSWYVILNGAIEITHLDGRAETLCMGNSFGISPSLDKQYMNGIVRTKVDDCQFVCIAQQDYWRILNHVEKNTHKVEEEGEIVMVKEHRELDRSGTRKGHIVIKGTPERLILHLVEEHSVVDSTYIEDFLLTYRTFISCPMEVGKKLLEWFIDEDLRDKVTRIVLLWVNNHFNDFEGDPLMTQFLEEFENNLETTKMKGHLRLLNIACAAKAKWRQTTLLKSSRESPLHFSLLGGSERGFGIFIEAVDPGSKAAEAGLKRGDQIMEINGQNFENISYSKAIEILRNNTHLSIAVKTNIFVFKELLSRITSEKNNGGAHIPKIQEKKGNRYSIPDLPVDMEQMFPTEKGNKKIKANTVSGGRNKIRKILDKTRFSILPPKPFSDGGVSQSQDDSVVGTRQCRHSVAIMPIPGTLSSSSPDLLQPTASVLDFSNPADIPDQVIRVFKVDQQSCYIIISKDTTAKDVVAHAVNEFGLTAAPDTYSLCEVSISPEGVIKQRRLPDQLSKLADRIQLNGRYYLKNNMETETLCSDDDAQELLRESQISLLQLSTVEVATQLSMRDFELFRNIEPTEYVDDLFRLDSKQGCANLKQFEEVINQETFWVATEILRESNQIKRMKIIKHFIKIALHCQECKNFNSMFAIISGLNLAPVTRLKGTWEKLPNKYEKLFDDLQEIFDPSRNMAKYRNVLTNQSMQPPIIPLFPVVKKDLTFLHEGNDSSVEGLVNFEKLRMIAKEIRHVIRMTSANMDPAVMFRQRSLSQGSTNSNMLDVQGGAHKKRVRRSSLLNAKKLYEDAQMARKVKQYLSNLNVETDEEKFQIMSLQCEPAYSTLSKNLSERRSAKSDMSPVSMRSGIASGKSHQQHRMSQVLQVPAVNLYPFRNKSTAKDTASASTSSPQCIKKPLSLSDDIPYKKAPEDSISNTSSLHSSPPGSPQGSPRKVGNIPRSQNSSQVNLSGSSSSLTSENSTKNSGVRSGTIGHALLSSTKSENFSDLSQSEISSRSSIVSNSSVDSISATTSEEHPLTQQPNHMELIRTGNSMPTTAECKQPCASHSIQRPFIARCSTFASSASNEELAHEFISVDAADSGRGSWTSCSSNSHDNFQSLQCQRVWDLSPFRNKHVDGPIAEVELTGQWADNSSVCSEDLSRTNRHSRGSLELNQSRQSWASSSSLSDTYEGNYGTIKRRVTENPQSAQEDPSDSKPATDPSYKTVTSSTDKGLIVYCVTSPQKDSRYRGPPPTPPGYLGIPLVDVKEGSSRKQLHLKPPDYNVAVHRSKMVSPYGTIDCQPEAGIQSKMLVQSQTHNWHSHDSKLANVSLQGAQDSHEDEEQVSAV